MLKVSERFLEFQNNCIYYELRKSLGKKNQKTTIQVEYGCFSFYFKEQ